jgi:hypothetical protein
MMCEACTVVARHHAADCPLKGQSMIKPEDYETVDTLLGLTPARWRELAEGPMKQTRRKLTDQADHLATNLARFSAYLRAREQGRTHEQAVRAQNTAAAKVRRALGFSIARDDKSF